MIDRYISPTEIWNGNFSGLTPEERPEAARILHERATTVLDLMLKAAATPPSIAPPTETWIEADKAVEKYPVVKRRWLIANRGKFPFIRAFSHKVTIVEERGLQLYLGGKARHRMP